MSVDNNSNEVKLYCVPKKMLFNTTSEPKRLGITDEVVVVVKRESYDELVKRIEEMENRPPSQKYSDVIMALSNERDLWLKAYSELKDKIAPAIKALEFYENTKRLILDVRDLPENAKSKSLMDNGETARAALEKIK